MLLVGLIVTMGIGSSFSTVPIIATIYVPLAMHLGFSAAAIVSLILLATSHEPKPIVGITPGAATFGVAARF